MNNFFPARDAIILATDLGLTPLKLSMALGLTSQEAPQVARGIGHLPNRESVRTDYIDLRIYRDCLKGYLPSISERKRYMNSKTIAWEKFELDPGLDYLEFKIEKTTPANEIARGNLPFLIALLPYARVWQKNSQFEPDLEKIEGGFMSRSGKTMLALQPKIRCN